MISKSDHFEMCLNIWCTLLCTCICLFFGLVIVGGLFFFFVTIFLSVCFFFFSAEAGHGRVWTAWTEALKKNKRNVQSWRQNASRGSELLILLFLGLFFFKATRQPSSDAIPKTAVCTHRDVFPVMIFCQRFKHVYAKKKIIK